MAEKADVSSLPETASKANPRKVAPAATATAPMRVCGNGGQCGTLVEGHPGSSALGCGHTSRVVGYRPAASMAPPSEAGKSPTAGPRAVGRVL